MRFTRPMKRTLIITGMVLLIATTAHAGILSSAGDWVLDNAIGIILTGIFTLVAGFFGGTSWGKMLLRAKVPITRLKDVAVRVHEARKPGSPGGKSMTNEEKDDILKDVEELLLSFVEVFGKGK